MKNKKGFTLVELLAVIVVLGIIIVIVSRSVINNLNESKKRVNYLAAKEITEMADTYFAVESGSVDVYGCISVSDLINEEYIESNATNPATGENGGNFEDQKVCKSEGQTEDDSFELGDDNYYSFDGYIYCIGEDSCSEFFE